MIIFININVNKKVIKSKSEKKACCVKNNILHSDLFKSKCHNVTSYSTVQSFNDGLDDVTLICNNTPALKSQSILKI